MSRPAYRGLTADDLTGPAAGLYSAMRTMGVSERAALHEAVDAHVPRDPFDAEVDVIQRMNGCTRASAERSVALRHGGSVAEARRRLREATAETPVPTAQPLREGVDSHAGTSRDEFRRRVDAAEARGLTFDQALAEATRWQREQRARRQPQTTTRAPGTAAPSPSSSAATTTNDRELREANDRRSQAVLSTPAERVQRGLEAGLSESAARLMGVQYGDPPAPPAADGHTQQEVRRLQRAGISEQAASVLARGAPRP